MNITKKVHSTKINIDDYTGDIRFLLKEISEIDSADHNLTVSIEEFTPEIIHVDVVSDRESFIFHTRFVNSKSESTYIKVFQHTETFNWRIEDYIDVVTKAIEMYEYYLRYMLEQERREENMRQFFYRLFN